MLIHASLQCPGKLVIALVAVVLACHACVLCRQRVCNIVSKIFWWPAAAVQLDGKHRVAFMLSLRLDVLLSTTYCLQKGPKVGVA